MIPHLTLLSVDTLQLQLRYPRAAFCPPKLGYVTKSDTNWKGSDKTTVSQTSASNAEKICNLDQYCLGWNSFGYYILRSAAVQSKSAAAAGVTFVDYSGLCTYMKTSSMSSGDSSSGSIQAVARCSFGL